MAAMTLDEAVGEVLNILSGLDLTYDPELDRYRSITRGLNRALRDNSLEAEWSCYADVRELGAGVVQEGEQTLKLAPGYRPRISGDDAVMMVKEGHSVKWAYFLPRDAIHKYRSLQGLWVAASGRELTFSRPFTAQEATYDLHVPVMREPWPLMLPPQGVDVEDKYRKQEIDFEYPDLVVARAVYRIAQADPVAQPRVPTLEQDYKTLMYQLLERDTNHTDTPYVNEFDLGLQNGLHNTAVGPVHPRSNFF